MIRPLLLDAALRFEPFIPWWVLLPLALLLMWSVRRAYQRSTRPISIPKRFLLGAVRLCAFLILLFCLSRPVLVNHHVLTERGLCFIAVDNSTSMKLRDLPGGKSRWDGTIHIFKTNRTKLDKVANEFELHRYLFDAQAQETGAAPGEDAKSTLPTGTSTDIAEVLNKISSDSAGMPTSGAILISDGRHNTPNDVVAAAMDAGRAQIPIYTIGMGQDATPDTFKDIRIKDLVVPERAFIGSKMILRVEVDSTLKKAESVPLTVEINGKKVYQSPVEFPEGANAVIAPIEIPYTPDAVGVHRVIATLAMLPGEADINNNTRAAFFRVYKTKLGIWYVEGAIRKEFGAIRSALETAPNVNLMPMDAFMTRAMESRELLPNKPDDVAQTKLVIIGDLPASRFDTRALADLADFVETGGSVLMIGGMSNFGAGGWQNSPLAPALPVEMATQDGMSGGPLTINVSDDDPSNPILMIGKNAEQSASVWKLLPPLPGINRVSRVKPAAHVLLRAGSRELLVVQEYGKGRSAVFTADMTWQWILKANQPEAHKTFWRNLITWLTRSNYRDSDKAIFADSPRLQYLSGEEMLLRSTVSETEKDLERIKNADVIFTLSRVEGETETKILQENVGKGMGEHLKRFAVGNGGSYRFKAALISSTDHRVIDTDVVDLQVTAPDVENDNPRANLKLLRRVSALTGGTYFDPAHAGDAFDALRKRQTSFSKEVSEITELWSDPFILVVFVVLLSLEWFLRKRWGLV